MLIDDLENLQEENSLIKTNDLVILESKNKLTKKGGSNGSRSERGSTSTGIDTPKNKTHMEFSFKKFELEGHEFHDEIRRNLKAKKKNYPKLDHASILKNLDGLEKQWNHEKC